MRKASRAFLVWAKSEARQTGKTSSSAWCLPAFLPHSTPTSTSLPVPRPVDSLQMIILWPYSGGAGLLWAKLINWACAWLPIYRHTLHIPQARSRWVWRRSREFPPFEGQKENKEIMAHRNSEPQQLLSTLNFYQAACLDFLPSVL